MPAKSQSTRNLEVALKKKFGSSHRQLGGIHHERVKRQTFEAKRNADQEALLKPLKVAAQLKAAEAKAKTMIETLLAKPAKGSKTEAFKKQTRMLRWDILDNINKEDQKFTYRQKVNEKMSRLGFKPKNKYENYKVLQEKIKAGRQQLLDKNEDYRNRGMHDFVQKRVKKRKKKDANYVGNIDLGGKSSSTTGILRVKKRDIKPIQ